MFGFLARIFGFCTPDAASAAREGADQEALACETYTAPTPHDARREHTTFVQEAVVQLDAVDFSVQSPVPESQTSARHNPSRRASSAGILEILNDSNGSTESVVSRTFDDAAAQATPFHSQPSDMSGTVENQTSSNSIGNGDLAKPATVDASGEDLPMKSDAKPLESASSELPKTVQSEVFSQTVESGQDLEMKSDAKSLEPAPSELPKTVSSEASSDSIEPDEDLEVKSDVKPLDLASIELPKTVQSEDSSKSIESEDLPKPVMAHASKDLETKSEVKPLDPKPPGKTGSPTEIRKPLQHALADTPEHFETTSNTKSSIDTPSRRAKDDDIIATPSRTVELESSSSLLDESPMSARGTPLRPGSTDVSLASTPWRGQQTSSEGTLTPMRSEEQSTGQDQLETPTRDDDCSAKQSATPLRDATNTPLQVKATPSAKKTPNGPALVARGFGVTPHDPRYRRLHDPDVPIAVHEKSFSKRVESAMRRDAVRHKFRKSRQQQQPPPAPGLQMLSFDENEDTGSA